MSDSTTSPTPPTARRRRVPRRLLALGAALATAATVLVAAPWATAASTLTNPGFDSNGASQTPTGWSESGTVAASKSEYGGRNGGYHLAHWASAAYTVETTQTLTGLTAGTYTMTAWTRSSGGQGASYISLRNCGSSEVMVYIPTSTSSWTQISGSINVTSAGNCTVVIRSRANANNWINVDDVTFTRSGSTGGGSSTISIRGVDLSALKKNEDKGALYYDANGNRGDAITILRNGGANYARLKVWVNPADGYNNKARVLTMASRIKAAGMKLLVDFHYSDSWADPGHQTKPAAWSGYSFAQLRDAVYNHTYDVLNALRNQGTTADMVQVGNELNAGMLLPDGTSQNFYNLGQLLKSGINAVKAVNTGTRVMLHLAEGGNNSLFRWWFDGVVGQGVQFDVIGASYYPYWHGSLSGLQANLNDMATRYNKDVVVVETAYGFTTAQKDAHENIFNSSLASAGGFPASAQGQVDELKAVYNVVRNVPNNRGLGVFYWEPAWTAVAGNGWDPTNPNSGNAWENQAMFDYNSRALPVVAVLGTA
ncbi:glycosyl hydrolase 53 family protein [Luedemannella flava]|uniref:Arabinogalactan endo-beta-1,4-galactanase n=1 Tax=Luedemannella flava TaxID=349316 RepID=A0ABP4YA17_9ACTN